MTSLVKFFNPRTLFILVLAGVILTAERGPDQEHYASWGQAAVSGDIFRIRADQRSPLGLPFFQWSAGPGLMMAPVMVSLPMCESHSAAFLTGFVCVIVFWTCLYLSLKQVSNEVLAAFGSAIAFVATPLGYYSLAISSETYSLLPVVVLLWRTVTMARGDTTDPLTTGAATGMLLLLRPYWAAYAWPSLLGTA